MDRDTRLHFLQILRDGADLHGLEAFTTDPIRFVHRGDVDWSDPDWVGDVPTEMNTGRSTTATPKDVQRRVETAASLWSKDAIAHAANSTGTHQDPVAPAPPMDTRILAGASARTHYEVLELPAGSPMEEVYKAYLKLRTAYNPARFKDPDQRRAAEAKQRSLFEAYVFLSQALKEEHHTVDEGPPAHSGSLRSGFASYTDAEVERWLYLRAVEWNAWPTFVSQPLVPVLLALFPVVPVLAGVLIADFFWRFVRYSFVSPTLAKVGALSTTFLKWPCALGSAIYLFAQQRYVLAVVAALWPLVAGFVNFPVAIVTARLGFPSQIGRIERSLAEGIGYVSGA